MNRTALDQMECSIARALDVVGTAHAVLILRNAFNGMRTFDAFQAHLGMSSSVLAARLKLLTTAGILEKRPSPTDRRSFEYRLTAKGRDLYPVLVALLHWGETWDASPDGPRLTLIETATGRPVQKMAVRSEDGRALDPREVTAVPGPGAGHKTHSLAGWRRRG